MSPLVYVFPLLLFDMPGPLHRIAQALKMYPGSVNVVSNAINESCTGL